MAFTYTPSTNFSTAGTTSGNSEYKDVTVTVAVGDLVVAMTVTENSNSVGTQTTTVQAGSTGAVGTWTNGLVNVTAGAPGFTTAWAVATTAGTLIIRQLASVANSACLMGTGIWVIPAAEWTGTPSWSTMAAHDTDGKLSVVVGATSTVIFGGADWSAAAPGATSTPSGGTQHSVFSDGVHYGMDYVSWINQAAGTRNYGPASPAGNDWIGGVWAIAEPVINVDPGPGDVLLTGVAGGIILTGVGGGVERLTSLLD